jgi:hypothetical protein
VSDVPLGTDCPLERTCGRWTAGTFGGEDEEHCGKPARFHVIWSAETMENSYTCLNHAREATERWRSDFYHEVGPCCGMPGARFFLDENVCRYEDGLPIIEWAREAVVS